MLGRRSTNTNMEEHHHHRHHHHHNLSYRLEALVQCTDMDRLESITGGATTATTTATTTSAADFEGYSLNDMVRFGSGTLGSDMSDLIKTQIATHPLYPQLLFAYIECQKVGAPPEVATLLEEIGRENHRTTSTCAEIGADPELDEFMESYCEVLNRYKEELSRPFDEATVFLNNIESQLSSLCIDAPISTVCVSDNEAGGGSSEEELSCCEVEAPESQEYTVGMPPCDKNLKEVLLRKYSGYLSSLRKEFLKKRKNGKLPKDARMTLLDWWNGHYRWPYPTEEEKLKLSEVTGLDQKQINNWFINQRKRHWKPSEDMRFALMEGVSGGIEAATYFDGEGAGQDV